MSESRRSPSFDRQAISEDRTLLHQPDNMQINTVPVTSTDGSLLQQANKGNFPIHGLGGFMLPNALGMSALQGIPAIPLIGSQDLLQSQLLHQMKMLSFRNQLFQSELMAENGKMWQEQRDLQNKLEEQKFEEVHKLSLLKQKPKEQQSAIASSEVKQHLRSALLRRQNPGYKSQSDIKDAVRNWKRTQSNSSPPSNATSSASRHPLSSSMSPPFTCSTSTGLGKIKPCDGPQTYNPEFPIRKTLSEPNLKVKTKLKNKLMQDRLNSPLMNRRHCDPTQDMSRLNGSITGLSSSPPMKNLLGSTPALAKEMKASKRPFEETLPSRYPTDNSLYISMPNIPLGKGMGPKPTHISDAANRMMPLTGPLMNPYAPSIAGITEEDYLASQGLNPNFSPLHDARRLAHPYRNKPAAGDAPQRHGSHPKPLSRTQSAPLPMMHPQVAASLLLAQTSNPQALREHQELLKQHEKIMQDHKKKLIRGHLRQTLLSKTSSKSHMEHVDEESEQRLIQEMQESREDEHNKPLHSSHNSIYSSTSRSTEFRVNDRPAASQGLDLSTGVNASRRKAGPRYLARTHSSPLVGYKPRPAPTTDVTESPIDLASPPNTADPEATGVIYDENMLRHHCPCGNNNLHLENPSRIQSIWSRLVNSGLVERAKRIDGKKATIEQLQLCHSASYSLYFGLNAVSRKKHEPELTLPEIRFQKLPCGGLGVDSDTVWNEDHSPQAARFAVGSVIELASRVYEGQLNNGMAIVRPPGHHSEQGTAMGFCFFNSVAIAAKHLKHKLGASKILILDWDVHHGNGTQQMTYDDPGILYVSLHRHDNGNFFPGTGSATDCGEKQGLGFNVNIPFAGLEPPMGDAEYMAAFRSIVMPIVEDFKPQITLVSAGFDAADGHAAPLGGYNISSAGFGFMTKQLMSACKNKVVLVLEGGYNLSSMSDASEMCMRALLGDNVSLPSQEEILRSPSQNAVQTLQQCASIQAQFWPSVLAHKELISCSFVDSLRVVRPVTAVSPNASLKIQGSSTESEPMEES